MASETFTPIVPTVAGVTLTSTAAVDGGNEYDYIPISDSKKTVVVITNSAVTAKTVTFTSQADSWGNTGASLNKVITVPASTTVITGVWLRNRWAGKDTPTAGAYNCTVAYQTPANISIAVLHVPVASKD